MLWVACARKLKKTREKKIRVAKFDNSDNGASVLIGLFKKRCHTNGFSDFRAANFLILYFINAFQNVVVQNEHYIFTYYLWFHKCCCQLTFYS